MSQDTSHLTFGAYLKAYFKQCLETLKHPKMLLPTAILAVVWIGLGILQNKVGRNLPLSILNFLTFAQGGLYGGILGAVGGIIGKIVVAAFVNVMIVPLFYKKNPFANLKSGYNEIIKTAKFESTEAFVSLLKGFGVALLLYSIFNVTQSLENSLVGIVSAVALISAVARKGGFLWGLVLSWLNTVSKGKKVSYQQVLRVLTGMTFGFALGVVLSAAGSMWAGSLGIIALIVGWIMGRGSKKEAVATVLLVGVFLMAAPKSGQSFGGMLKMGWVLESVEEDIQSSGSGQFFASKGTISNLVVNKPGHLSYDYTSNWDAAHASGHCTGTFEFLHKDSYMPGEEVLLGFSGSTEFSEITAFGSYTEIRTSVDDAFKANFSMQNAYRLEFRDPEEIGADAFDFYYYIHILGAHVGYIYHFRYVDFDDDVEFEMPNGFNILFGGDKHASDLVSILIGLLGAAGGAAGAGLGDGGEIPGGEGPLGNGPDPEPTPEPTPEELEWERYQKEKDERFKKYLKDNPDGTKTYTDPATGEKHTLYPRYNEETGKPEGWVNENDSHYDEDKLNDWLAWRERNSEHFAQNEAEAQQNLAQQRAMNQAQNDYDRERGSSAAADAHKAYKEECEKEVYLTDLALKHGFINADDKDALKKALLKDKHEALEEGAEAMKDAAFWNDAVNYAETTERIADTTISVMGEFPGNRGVKNIYTVVKSIVKHGTESKVKGDSVWAGIAQGAAEGGLGVLQNQEMTGVFGTSALGKLAKAGVNIGAESAKSVINDLMDPDKSASEILDNATNAAINRIYYEGTGTIAKTYGEAAADAAASGVDEIGSFAQEMGFHTDSANALADEINKYRHVFFRI